ncbi:HAMP domain-containing histidine kinase [Streptomonospora sp. PA3]|uniref:ATP-binding protein n=1 Tax=Streptomonospora sp. PA3 TaxID=2607326 RepID=UPI0012DE497F|nr:ATP-binding protein [Streptomonospora sp. PA3]MUL39690.1 HAMP domain-containing histidine kinase [Streptomonospora sp. PA3]
MRRRMLFSTLVVTVIAVLLLGLPLGALTYTTIYSQAERQLEQEARVIAAEIDSELQDQNEIDQDRLTQVHPHRYIEIRLSSGEVLTAGGWQIDPRRPEAPRTVSASAPSMSGATVTVWRDASRVREGVIQAWLGIASLSLLAIGVAVGLAMLQARRLTLPLVDLAATAERLGSGIVTPWGHRYGISEADRVAEVLDRSAERIAGLIATERHFATDASHQLRTPLTALSMRLEEIIAEADNPETVREEGEAALAQTERLVDTVESLLGRARKSQQSGTAPIDIDAALDEFTSEWGPILSSDGRQIVVTGERGLSACIPATDLTQILASLVDNARRHGAGTVTVRVLDGGGSVRIEVSDEGPGVPEEIAGRIFEREVTGGNGTGLGLALARHIAESEGARIELIQTRPTTFALFLPPPGSGSATPPSSSPV